MDPDHRHKMIDRIVETYKRIRTSQTHVITSMPIAILMPHSSCNCRCTMCDIWKANAHTTQLTEQDILALIKAFRKLGTRQVVFSGGEALLHSRFFDFCRMLKNHHLKITLLT